MKKIAILGSTGSIGTQTLQVVESNPDMQVVSLAAGKNITLLEAQTRQFLPKLVCVFDEEKAIAFKAAVADLSVKVVSGMEGLIEAATVTEADVVVTAFVGMIGIRPTIAAMEAGKDIALANKETLVTAGHIIMPLAREKKVRILPVDSEHSAIFQALNGENRVQIHKILLTASGGPFREFTRQQMQDIELEDALKHPNWAMGAKITIDSSTMANKGLEVIEARWLFDVAMDQVQVVIQPQSVIHSMVEFVDGSVMAQLGTPDMKLPIQYALTYPQRRTLAGGRLDFTALKQIHFEEPDMVRFPALALAYEAGTKGGNLPTIFNAANEFAVQLFLNRKVHYLDIPDLIQGAMERIAFRESPDVADILATETETGEMLNRLYERMRG